MITSFFANFDRPTFNNLADVVFVTMRQRQKVGKHYDEGAFGRILAAGYLHMMEVEKMPASLRKNALIAWITERVEGAEISPNDDRNAYDGSAMR